MPPEAEEQPEVLHYSWWVAFSVSSKALGAHRSGLSTHFTHWNEISQGAWPLDRQWKGAALTRMVSGPSVSRPGRAGASGVQQRSSHTRRRVVGCGTHDEAGWTGLSPFFPGSLVSGGKADAGSLQGYPLSLQEATGPSWDSAIPITWQTVGDPWGVALLRSLF